ncbi:hypothetical protein V2J09_023057 [Rumex salicifolius]
MDALMASYGYSDSDSESCPTTFDKNLASLESVPQPSAEPLPPPPISLLNIPNSFGGFELPEEVQPCRVRNFPHVEGNYALHIFIPVHVPQATKKELSQFLKRISSQVPDLHVVDVDIPLKTLCNDIEKLEQVVLGREFHISLGRTVPIRVHQIDTVVSMLRQRLQSYKQYWIDFDKWRVFVNDDRTRSFISMEVVGGGLPEITKQIHAVDVVYRLHNLPEFYKDPRPHISLAWALGDASDLLQRVILQEMKRKASVGGFSQKRLFTVKFGGILCKIGNKTYNICKVPE